MQLIVPHASTDLDALGSAAGLRVLYPGATIVVPGLLLAGAAAFASLHRYHLPTCTPRDVDLDRVELLVVADTADPARLGALSAVARRPGVRIHLYDHHPREPGDLRAEVEVCEPVGATATLVAELLEESGAPMSPQVATALLLGIYADTSFLTLPSTTPRDARAVAFLLERGANLALAERFVSPDLTPPQQELLSQLLQTERLHTVRGVKIRIAPGETRNYVGGLALVVHRLLDLRPAAATFVAVRMGDRVHVVGRSEVPWVDARAVLAAFGGGGHPGAASAVVRSGDVDGVVAGLLERLEATVGTPLTARDLMKSPVRAISPDRTVAEAERLMLRYGYSGLVVTEGERVVGVVSRADAERARRHGLAHAPVKGVMAHQPIVVRPDTPLDEMQALMIERGVGRLPVVEDGRLVGIVTRSDLLGELYGSAAPHWHRRLHGSPGEGAAEATARIRERAAGLPPAALRILRAAGRIARDTAQPAYAVGGFVRDLLLGRPNMDIDIAVEGDGIAFAEQLARALGGQVHPVPRFGTAHVRLPEGIRVDVATARREFYEHAAALPRVEDADLREDLYRRDFTINALAVRLTPEGPGEVVDFFGGYADLRAGLIRVLHSLSFVEDPTRVLRAIRFACRYGMRLEDETARLAGEAVRSALLLRVSAERLRNELILILGEPAAGACLAALAGLGALEQVLPGVRWGDPVRAALAGAERLLSGDAAPEEPLPAAIRQLAGEVEPWLLRAACLAPGLAAGAPSAGLVERLRLRRRPRTVLEHVLGHWREALGNLSAAGLPPSRVVEVLEGWPAEGLALLWILGRESPAAEYVLRFLESWRHVRARVSARDLQQAGIPEGPAYRHALAAARRARLDGRAATREEELAAAIAAARAWAAQREGEAHAG